MRLAILRHASVFFAILFACFPLSACNTCVSFNDSQASNNYFNFSHGNWAPENNILESIISRGASSSNFTLRINGPCSVSFKWEVLEGYNYLELLCDGNITPYFLCKMDPNQLRHSRCVQMRQFDLTEGLHELKFCHRNNCGRGTARVYYICIKDMRIKYIYPSVEPELMGVAIGPSCKVSTVRNAFDYNVRIETDPPSLIATKPPNVELFILPPGTKNPILHGYGSSNGQGSFEWKGIKIKSNQTGLVHYWFKITFAGENQSIESDVFEDPLITNVILSTDHRQSILNSSCFNENYCIEVIGARPRLINLYFCDNLSCQVYVSRSYQSDKNRSIPICINKTWRNNERYPNGWEFELA